MTNNEKLVSPQELRSLLRYENGDLYWLPRPREHFKTTRGCKIFHSSYLKKKAGCLKKDSGYITLTITKDGRELCFRAHRVMWALVTGKWPDGEIDHKNHVRHDNRIENLRDISHQQNAMNAGISNANKSGATGVHFEKATGKWRSYITINGKRKYQGRFNDKQRAIEARVKAQNEYGFHENHGRHPF